jgi:tetratricopeptide (TPR) repeat protein
MRSVSFLILFIFLLGVAGPQEPPALGHISVRVRLASGVPLSTPARVRLSSRVGSFSLTDSTKEGSQADFRNLAIGEYVVEVSAAGFLPATEEASLMIPSATVHVFVTLRPEGVGNEFTIPAGPPLLAPKAQKELEAVGRALDGGDFGKAQAHLERALKLAPGHPEVHYFWGVFHLRRNENAQARASFEKAVSLYPNHASSLAGLARLEMRARKYPEAIALLERVLALEPAAWENHALLSSAYLARRELMNAHSHAERAIQLAGSKAPQLRVLLAHILAELGEKEAARRELEAFLGVNPNHPQAVAAQSLLNRLRSLKPDLVEPPPQTTAGLSPSAGLKELPLIRSEAPANDWAPPDVDSSVPPVVAEGPCDLAALLRATGQRVLALAENLESIAAKESVEHAELDPRGKVKRQQIRTFDYIVSIRKVRQNMLSVEESRDGSARFDGFPVRLLPTGLAALAMIFHPYYVEDFQMRCEGLADLRGQAAWSVHFRQRSDRPSRVRSYVTRRGSFPVALKGRAWIAANSYQILRLEADLVAPMPEAALERDHMSIEYAPVSFPHRQLPLYLPSRAELYVLFEGHRYRHRHAFRNFTYFAVDTRQRIEPPKQP